MSPSSQPSRSTSSQSKLEKIKQVHKALPSAIAEVNKILDEYGLQPEPSELPTLTQTEAEAIVLRIMHRFHTVATTLRDRHADRETIIINDEKDAQDLFHSLLWLHFDEVLVEEPMESVAGGTTFIDFLLPNERIGIELKNGNRGRTTLRKEINDDRANYGKHSRCDKLIVFVYDPNNSIRNIPAFERHLSGITDGVEAKTYVLPKSH
jgi:REase_DpnII-MboI